MLWRFLPDVYLLAGFTCDLIAAVHFGTALIAIAFASASLNVAAL